MLTKEDIRAVKRANPLAGVVAQQGIELRPSGRAYVGRCPFHVDGGRPNFYVVPQADAADDFYHCFRCAAAGDVIAFVCHMDRLSFGQAIAVLEHETASIAYRQRRPLPVLHRANNGGTHWGPAEQASLSAAVTLYHHTLLREPTALEYLRSRGVERPVIERCRIGYAAGGELASYLAWRRLPLRAAFRAGLLRPGGREAFAGRIVVPEIRCAQPIWLIGRVLGDPAGDQPKYLGLPGRGRKPLLGWEFAVGSSAPIAVESTFDWLTLVGWRLPGLSLLGTRVRPSVLKAFARFRRVYLALNNDEAGRLGTTVLASALGERVVPVELPAVKDISELAGCPDGRRRFLAALQRAGWSAPLAAAA